MSTSPSPSASPSPDTSSPWLVALAAEQTATGKPRTAVNLAVHNSDRVAADILGGKAELGFVEGPDLLPGLAHRVVATDERVVVVLPGHPWGRRTISAADLAATALVARELRAIWAEGCTLTGPARDLLRIAARRAAGRRWPLRR